MPAKGKHRRTRAMRAVTRTIAVAGTGGAALALPLMGAAVANAAPAHSVSEQAVRSPVPTSAKKAAASGAEKNSDSRTYTVKSGDDPSKIADEQHVDGGRKKLYADNREAVWFRPVADPPRSEALDRRPGRQVVGAVLRAVAQARAEVRREARRREAGPEVDGRREGLLLGLHSNTGTQSAGTTSGYTSPVQGRTVGTPYHQSGSMWSSGYHTGRPRLRRPDRHLAEGRRRGHRRLRRAGGGAYGNQVVIQLADGHYAQYAHLSSLSVSAGQSVTAGQQVGLSGATGNVTGPHLHFEIRTTPDYGSDIDPIAFLRSHGVSV
ncbi:Peptidoglycan DD-metalloendopeptidase family protein OS=Streptomyces tendae OX=1932 GN=GUR47_02685 PE=4 SV=1 [Streptomyces tendae]